MSQNEPQSYITHVVGVDPAASTGLVVLDACDLSVVATATAKINSAHPWRDCSGWSRVLLQRFPWLRAIETRCAVVVEDAYLATNVRTTVRLARIACCWQATLDHVLRDPIITKRLPPATWQAHWKVHHSRPGSVQEQYQRVATMLWPDQAKQWHNPDLAAAALLARCWYERESATNRFLQASR